MTLSKSAEAKAAKDQLQYLPPLALPPIARAMKSGADKYGAANWRVTRINASDYVGALGRHLVAWAGGQDKDPDTGEHPLAHLAAGCMVVLDALATEALDDDRPYGQVTEDRLQMLSKALEKAREAGLQEGIFGMPKPGATEDFLRRYQEGLRQPSFHPPGMTVYTDAAGAPQGKESMMEFFKRTSND